VTIIATLLIASVVRRGDLISFPTRGTLASCCSTHGLHEVLVPELGDGLGEINLDATIVDKYIIHLFVSFNTCCLGFKFDEGVV
jgi:hypothetical protein